MPRGPWNFLILYEEMFNAVQRRRLRINRTNSQLWSSGSRWELTQGGHPRELTPFSMMSCLSVAGCAAVSKYVASRF